MTETIERDPATRQTATNPANDHVVNGIPLSVPPLPKLTGEILAGEECVETIKKLLGPEVMIEVVTSMDRAIPRPLHLSQSTGEAIEIRQPEVVGVRCAAASNGLVAAGFPSSEALQTFLDANAPIRTCPVTKWHDIMLLWLRTDFSTDQNHEFNEFLWFSRDIVPLCWLEDESHIDIVRTGKPTTVSFTDIVFPNAAEGLFRYEVLKSLFGPFFVTKKGKKSLNLNLWAAWLSDRLGLRFDPRIREFRLNSAPTAKSEILARSTVRELILGALQDSARLEPQHFPLAEIRPRRVEELVALMEVMTATASAISDVAGLEEFLTKKIVHNPEADITSEELWVAYQAHCQGCGCDRYTRHEFFSLIEGRIRLLFGRTISHSIKRGTARRGYRQISLTKNHIKPGHIPGATMPVSEADKAG